jgi:hypothetical protein
MKMKLIRKFFFVLIGLSVLSACEYEFIEVEGPPDDDNLPQVSFSTEVASIFSETGCINCHGGSTPPDLRASNAYNSLMSLNLVVPGEPDSSKIYTYPHPITGTHNVRYSSIADVNLIYAWIKNGAENN